MTAPVLADFIKAYDVRGVVPDQLNVDVAYALGSAFAQVVALPEKAEAVVVGHDMRPSSPELSRAFADGDFSTITYGYVVMRLASTVNWLRAAGFQ